MALHKAKFVALLNVKEDTSISGEVLINVREGEDYNRACADNLIPDQNGFVRLRTLNGAIQFRPNDYISVQLEIINEDSSEESEGKTIAKPRGRKPA